MAETTEVGRSDLRVGDVLVSKQDATRTFRIEKIEVGINGYGWPYLVLKGEDDETVEHDTSFDGISGTYTVQR